MDLPLPSGFTFDYEEPHGPPAPSRRLVGQVIDSGRRKPVPRTLQQAFPQSEGYRIALYCPAPRWARTDRICWAIVIALACLIVRWAYLAPKVPT